VESHRQQRKDGGMRLMLAAINCPKGDPGTNLATHIDELSKASAAGCDLVVFPEMSLTGSVDPRARPDRLVPLDAPVVAHLVAATADHHTAAVFGVAEAGRYITQVYGSGGQIVGSYRKRHLGEGEEAYRPGTDLALWRLGPVAFGPAICAEADVDFAFDDLAAAGARLVVFCAAPGLSGRRRDDAAMKAGYDWWYGWGWGNARRHAMRTGAWVAMATQAGSTEDEDFPGGAALFGPTGDIAARLPDWRPGSLVVDVPIGDR
jgi:predicted amidohydrolase